MKVRHPTLETSRRYKGMKHLMMQLSPLMSLLEAGDLQEVRVPPLILPWSSGQKVRC